MSAGRPGGGDRRIAAGVSGPDQAPGSAGRSRGVGALPFEASSEGRETIADIFEIDLTVPRDYPTALPWVRETGGRICEAYHHVFTNGKLCLAVPVEERLRFRRDPCLRGFVTNLVVPYCYGYCYWERHGVHPFGEREHGGEGIARFYIDWLGLPGEVQALEVALHLAQHGYRGHHDCPCGSGAKLRDCHGAAVLELHRSHTAQSARYEFGEILGHCLKKRGDGELVFPRSWNGGCCGRGTEWSVGPACGQLGTWRSCSEDRWRMADAARNAITGGVVQAAALRRAGGKGGGR